jgi:hypothetical protein
VNLEDERGGVFITICLLSSRSALVSRDSFGGETKVCLFLKNELINVSPPPRFCESDDCDSVINDMFRVTFTESFALVCFEIPENDSVTVTDVTKY